MRTFKEMANATEGINEEWTKSDLVALVEGIHESEIGEVTNMIVEFIDSELETDLSEKKMSKEDKKDAKLYAKTSAFKKAKKLKAKCMEKNGDKVRNSNGKLTCGSDGKITKGMSKADKIAMAKARKLH